MRVFNLAGQRARVPQACAAGRTISARGQRSCARSSERRVAAAATPAENTEAMQSAKPAKKDGIPGLQAFVAGIWDRKRRVPNHLYRDPLAVLFEEFDADSDGHLTIDEITNALNSEGVDISKQQVAAFVEAADENQNRLIELHEFSRFVFKLADEDAHEEIGA